MAALGRMTEAEPVSRGDKQRVVIAFTCAALLHLFLFQVLMFTRPEAFEQIEDIISVSLITLPPSPQVPDVVLKPDQELPELDEAPLPPAPTVKPRLKTAPPPQPAGETIAPDILASSRPASAADNGNKVPPSQNGTTPSPGRTADDIRIDEGLKSLAAELRCLKGFSEECAETRKDVFEEFQMTETDKVYTKKYAHTGMPVEYYGMSERQIREKLNLKFAGENGLYIPFTNIGIDGELWDVIHGVNKRCEWKIAINPEGVGHGAIKDCPDYLPAAKEDRDRRNKYRKRLEANEARRRAENVNAAKENK
jgi:hypothetical protein